MKFRKPELIPLLFIIAATILLTGLGLWQLQRLAWKEGLIAQIETAQSLPALTSLPDAPEAMAYRNIRLTGSFLYGKTMHLVGPPKNGIPGFFILTPLRLEDGRIILVNRGFAPEGKEEKPQGLQEVSGVLRLPREKRLFTPASMPEKNLWFYEDIRAMARLSGLELPSIVLEAVGPRKSGVWPMPSDGRIVLRNDHLGYAITWLVLAVTGLVMFAIYYRLPPAKKNP